MHGLRSLRNEAVIKRLQPNVDGSERLFQLFKIYRSKFILSIFSKSQADVFHGFSRRAEKRHACVLQLVNLRLNILRIIIRTDDHRNELDFCSLLTNFLNYRNQLSCWIKM